MSYEEHNAKKDFEVAEEIKRSAINEKFSIVVFPVCSCASVFYISYPLWIILLIYSSFEYKD